MEQMVDKLMNIRARVKNAGNAELIAVSKFRSKDEIATAISCGHRLFGENKVQEALAKWPEIKAAYPDIILHLIGPLQTNKIKDAFKIFDVIETVDRKSLADGILKEMQKSGKQPDCYIQVNTGAEPQKAGILPEDADSFIKYCIEIGLPIKGLMCIPPADQDPKPHFKMLKNIADRHNLKILSMGMSSDFEVAITCGATHVRVGTDIFGARV